MCVSRASYNWGPRGLQTLTGSGLHCRSSCPLPWLPRRVSVPLRQGGGSLDRSTARCMYHPSGTSPQPRSCRPDPRSHRGCRRPSPSRPPAPCSPAHTRPLPGAHRTPGHHLSGTTLTPGSAEARGLAHGLVCEVGRRAALRRGDAGVEREVQAAPLGAWPARAPRKWGPMTLLLGNTQHAHSPELGGHGAGNDLPREPCQALREPGGGPRRPKRTGEGQPRGFLTLQRLTQTQEPRRETDQRAARPSEIPGPWDGPPRRPPVLQSGRPRPRGDGEVESVRAEGRTGAPRGQVLVHLLAPKPSKAGSVKMPNTHSPPGVGWAAVPRAEPGGTGGTPAATGGQPETSPTPGPQTVQLGRGPHTVSGFQGNQEAQ